MSNRYCGTSRHLLQFINSSSHSSNSLIITPSNMKPSPMDISFLLNSDSDQKSVISPRRTPSTKISNIFNANAPKSSLHYASKREEMAVKAAQNGTLSPQALQDVVRIATESARMGEGAQSTSTSPNSRRSTSTKNPVSVGKRRSKKCTQVYRLNKESGKLERREDMDALIRVAADTYEPHRNARRFLCYCDKWYNKREHLNRHVQLVHLEQRPFQCTSCNLSFGTKYNMEVHCKTKKHKTLVEQ